MKWTIVILLFLFSYSMNAQICSYRVNSVSGMDGTRLVITEPIEIKNNFDRGPLEAWTTIYGDTALVLAFVLISPKDIPLSKGDVIELMSSEEKSVSLEIFQDPVLANTSPKKLTCLTILSEEDILSLENSKINQVFIKGMDYQHDETINKEKSREAIGKLISCVKKYLQ